MQGQSRVFERDLAAVRKNTLAQQQPIVTWGALRLTSKPEGSGPSFGETSNRFSDEVDDRDSQDFDAKRRRLYSDVKKVGVSRQKDD